MESGINRFAYAHKSLKHLERLFYFFELFLGQDFII